MAPTGGTSGPAMSVTMTMIIIIAMIAATRIASTSGIDAACVIIAKTR